MASAASVLAAAPSASAVTTIGSDLASAPTILSSCVQDCTFAQRGSLPGRQVTAPSDGVIVRWRIRAGFAADGEPVKLRVIRGTGVASTGAGSSQAESVPSNGIFTYDTRIPIVAGDYIGVDCCDDGGPFFVVTPGALRDEWGPPLGDGETAAPDFQTSDREILVNADIESDADGDGFGDETQDQCLGQPGPVNGCPEPSPTDAGDSTALDTTITKGPKDKTRTKTATFEFTGTDTRVISGFQCKLDSGAFAPCNSPHTVKVKKGKHVFEVRAVDQAGNADPTPATDTWKRKRKRKR
jgi:hypothetical protein